MGSPVVLPSCSTMSSWLIPSNLPTVRKEKKLETTEKSVDLPDAFRRKRISAPGGTAVRFRRNATGFRAKRAREIKQIFCRLKRKICRVRFFCRPRSFYRTAIGFNCSFQNAKEFSGKMPDGPTCKAPVPRNASLTGVCETYPLMPHLDIGQNRLRQCHTLVSLPC